MGNLNYFFLPLLAFASTSCGSKLPVVVRSPQAAKVEAPKAQTPDSINYLEGHLQKIDGGSLELSSLSNRPLVLTFASDSCLVCSSEADAMSSEFRKLGSAPQNVQFVTILVGAIKDDALDWIEMHNVDWSVTLDSGDALFRHYCPENLTPCTYVQTKEKGIALRRVGELKSDEIKAVTGEWK